MPISTVEFDLKEGFIHNWLVAGPQPLPVGAADAQKNPSKTDIAKLFYEKKSGITVQPVERGPLDKGNFTIGSYEGQWDYYPCREDHFIDLSTTCAVPTFLRSWAYCHLISPADQTVEIRLTTFGPADLWINKKLVFHDEQVTERAATHVFSIDLDKGSNKVLARFAGVADPNCVLALALQIHGGVPRVAIPTLIPSLSRRNELEAANERYYLNHDVFASGDAIYLQWPEGGEKDTYQEARLQTPQGQIFAQAEEVGKPGDQAYLGSAVALSQGHYQAMIMPRAWEYYESQIRVTKTLPLYSLGMNKFSEAPYGTFEERCREALLDAANRPNDLFAEIAKMALEAWFNLDGKVLVHAMESIQQRQAGSEILLLGLLGAVMRFSDKPGFPEGLKDRVQDCALGFRYRQDEPGSDALQFNLESRQIIFLACEILAGQLYPSQVFSNSGLTGKKHRTKAEAQAVDWIKERGMNGFVDWDSKESYAEILTALSYLVDLAKADSVWELASVLMDKIFYNLAHNSFKGVFGSTQGRAASTMSLKSGLLEATSGITRLMWGMGIFNQHIQGSVSLAMMENYELPPILSDIAQVLLPEVWTKEQEAPQGRPLNKVAYITPDYMLASAQDYRPGQPGEQEHIWQATLGANSLVFVNHPGCATENDVHTPNFWLGNGVLPRVAQIKNNLIALYNLPEDAWLDFTHAYFPTMEFDEYVLEGHAAFARKGDGYLALITAQPMELVQSGPTALRELRSPGRQNVWVCQMGRAEIDGDFTAFRQKVFADLPIFDGLTVKCRALNSGPITFGWDQPFSVNRVEQALSGFKHYDNIFTHADLASPQIEVQTAEYLLRLNFGELE